MNILNLGNPLVALRGYKFALTMGTPLVLAVAASVTLASCTPYDSPPQQVQASNPSVTYKYRGDQELVAANQNAVVFCSQYQSVPRTRSFSSDVDDKKVVVFECLRTTPMTVVAPQYNPNLTYSYLSDQELADSSRNAQIYCMNNGSQQVVSTIGTNPNGTRSVSFQCAPR